MEKLDESVLKEHVLDDKAKLTADEIHSYVTRIMYQKRSKMNPLWNNVLVAGVKDGKALVFLLPDVFFLPRSDSP